MQRTAVISRTRQDCMVTLLHCYTSWIVQGPRSLTARPWRMHALVGRSTGGRSEGTHQTHATPTGSGMSRVTRHGGAFSGD